MVHGRSCMLVLLLLLPIAIDASTPANSKVIRLAITTSVQNSGLLTYLLAKFHATHPYQFERVAVGSGKALRLGRTGDVDLVWVHSPNAEKQFVEEGYGVNHHRVMRNDFILVGPEADPGHIADASDIYAAFTQIARQQLTFVSRGDDSGTHKRERALWRKTQLDPYGKGWYLETGTGMAASLKVAEQQNAYLLIDRATFVVRNENKLKLLLQDPVNLLNPYSVIAVNKAKHAGINHEGATQLINWLISPEGQSLIAAYQYNGVQLFFPADVK